ncbi:Uncharacterized protein EJ110_NYTH30512 [Nymphaea thermarum]|nr:Uncharacterized protein EJ110_NYTH30512 [Nymphaea thermarum]
MRPPSRCDALEVGKIIYPFTVVHPSLSLTVPFSSCSHFILECLKEFFSTYDVTLFRWNGAELLSRTAARIVNRSDYGDQQLHIKIVPTSKFFPISSDDITSN